MNIDIDGLIELAKKATPGPWILGRLASWNGDGVAIRYVYRGSNDNHLTRVQIRSGNGDNGQFFDCDLDASFIAAASPDTIIALCERLREAEKTIQNALSELKAGDVRSAIDQLEAGNE